MKFTIIKSTSNQPARRGELSEIKNRPGLTLQTPLVLLHTPGDRIPHITQELVTLVSKEPPIVQIPILSLHNYRENKLRFDRQRVPEFVAHKSVTCWTAHDSSNLTIQKNNTVALFSSSCTLLLDSDKYMDVIEEVQPDMYTFLSDGDTNIASSGKRTNEAVENTVQFNQECLRRHKACEALKDALIVAPIAGGYCLQSRLKCIKQILQNDAYFQGYLIDGLHNNQPELELIDFEEVKIIVEGIIEKLPKDKLKMVQGCWTPINILKLVKSGVDVFDTSYTNLFTNLKSALIFAIGAKEKSDAYKICLLEPKFAQDSRPMLKGCKCKGCRCASRANIYQLIHIEDKLGARLIMIHNEHHMLRFFQKIRECIRDDTLNQLEARINEQYKSCHSR